MKLVTFNYQSRTRIGVLQDETVHFTSWNYDMLRLIQSGISVRPLHDSAPLNEARLNVLYRPGKILGIGRNYAAHAEELNNELPEKPLVFPKLTTSLIPSGGTITWRESLTQQVDWEGELAVIIGKPARNVSEEDAMNHVFGYTIANDVSARDLQDSDDQWVRAKGLDTFCPLGPCIVTRDEIPDPHDLTVKTMVNGEVKQQASTSLMMFKIPKLISFCSQAFTLEAGDIILTGTPAGVGKASGTFLKDGDEVRVTIDGIGEIVNTCKVLAD